MSAPESPLTAPPSTPDRTTHSARVSALDRFAQRVLLRRLAGLRRGELTLEASGTRWQGGESGTLATQMRVHDPRFFRRALFGGTLSIAESYLNGEWDCDDLTSLFRIFIRNMEAADGLDSAVARVAQWGSRLLHRFNANTRAGSRRNIEAHYDLGNDFFRLWLDETMAYSSGIFPRPEATLREASEEKSDRICRRLALTESDHVLEIGTGWGGFALHAASRYGCRVTTTTISREQRTAAAERVFEASLQDRITLLGSDYRDLTGEYDKLVSIEMIEAVGHRYLDDYFGQCGRLLRPEGSLLIQAIVMPERRYDQYLRSVDFIQRYVFPGGCCPSLAAMLDAAGRSSDLRLVHAEDFAPHYAETLRRWSAAFESRLGDVRRLGYPERFLRLWRYYLAYCEAIFEERQLSLLQIQFDKPLAGCGLRTTTGRASLASTQTASAPPAGLAPDLVLSPSSDVRLAGEGKVRRR